MWPKIDLTNMIGHWWDLLDSRMVNCMLIRKNTVVVSFIRVIFAKYVTVNRVHRDGLLIFIYTFLSVMIRNEYSISNTLTNPCMLAYYIIAELYSIVVLQCRLIIYTIDYSICTCKSIFLVYHFFFFLSLYILLDRY